MNKGKKAHPYTRYNSKGRLQLSLKKAGAGFAVENKEIIKVKHHIKDKVQILPNKKMTISLKTNTFSVIFLPHLFFFRKFYKAFLHIRPFLNYTF